MSQPYKQCTACGARALRIATRCPGCHREFPSTESAVARAGQTGGRRRAPRPAGLAAGVLVVAAIVIGTELSQSGGVGNGTTATAPAESAAAPAEVAFASNGGTVAAPPAGTLAPAAPPPQLRVARTWTHVRKARRKSADLEAVLTPGDTVLADSLQQGWYRVALDGEVLGYAYQSALAATDSLAAGGGLTP